MTYPDEMVASVVTERFVACQVNTQEEPYRPVVERYRQTWTPDLRLLDSEGFDLYHWNGYLPPAEFVAQLGVAQGHAYLRLQREDRAIPAFEEVLRRFPTAMAAPEAQYFLAVAKYKRSHEGRDLLQGWHRLQVRYPTSTWRVRQSFSEEH